MFFCVKLYKYDYIFFLIFFIKYRKISKELIRIEDEPAWILYALSESSEAIRTWSEKLATLCRIAGSSSSSSSSPDAIQERDRLFFASLVDLLVVRLAVRMHDNVERIVLCNGSVFHKSQMAYVLTLPIMQQLGELAAKLKQPDATASALLTALVYLPRQPAVNQQPYHELHLKLRELLKEHCQQQQQQQQQSTASLHLVFDDLLEQVRHVSVQLQQRLKQCNSYNMAKNATDAMHTSANPACIPANSSLDLL